MNGRRSKTLRASAALALACVVCLAHVARVGARKGGIKKSDAQKLVAAYSLLELNKGAVVVREITPGETAATVTAGVRVGVRYERDAAGNWHAVEVRVGDRQWEDLDLLARSLGADTLAPARAALDSLAAELDALAAAKKRRDEEKKEKERAEERTRAGRGGDDDGVAKKAKAGKKSDQKSAKSDQKSESDQKSDQRAADQKSNEKTSGKDEPELVRGALRVKNPETALSAMGKSAVVEAEIEAAFDVLREGGRWRVAAVRIGGVRLPEADAFARALDAEKGRAARADLEDLAAALEAFRRERGFYVVADTEVVLVDFLNPRYTARFIRVDPWHRPYEYEGARDSYTLRSNGPDGKPHTADDIERRGGR